MLVPASRRGARATAPEGELAHAIDSGVMFEATYDARHDEVVDAVIAARAGSATRSSGNT